MKTPKKTPKKSSSKPAKIPANKPSKQPGDLLREYASKRDFDKTCGVTGWTLHDLRRTARSLMSQAGVDADHAERALGHVIAGVRGTYDRHEFREEKCRAFAALAMLVERIVSPQPSVVPLEPHLR